MSENQEITRKSAEVADHGGPETEKGASMTPPAFQLKAGDDGDEAECGGKKDAPRQLKAPPFALNASPMQRKEDAQASKGVVQAQVAQLANNPVMDVITYIHGEMVRNFSSSEVSEIKSNLRMARIMAVLSPIASAYYSYQAYKKWYDMVRTGGPWDHKSAVRSAYGDWTDDAANSLSYYYDVWSNVHYGFIGRECGFDEWTLLAGAGAAQVMAGTVPDGYWRRRFETLGDADVMAAFDDPKDQEAIRVGFRLWSGSGSSVTTADILSQVRASAGALSTQAMASGGTTSP